MKTLLDVLSGADAIEIDGTFCRHFHLEMEECENDNDVILSLDFEVDFNIHEHYFTKYELETAVFNSSTNEWRIKCSATGTMLIAYNLEAISA